MESQEQRFGDLVKRVVRKLGARDNGRHRRITEAWFKALAPELRAKTRLVSIRSGVLEIEVETHALLQELAGFEKPKLLQELLKEVPGEIQDIRFVVYQPRPLDETL